MKSLNRIIDRFCARHNRFGIPNLMLIVIFGNALVFLLSKMDTTGELYGILTLIPYYVVRGQVWRLITFIFVPESGNIISLALFMYFYYFISKAILQSWGSGKFTIYYFSGVFLTIVLSFILYAFKVNVAVSGATYVNLSLFFAFASLYPDHRLLLLFIIPLKVKWMAYANAAYFIYVIIINAAHRSPFAFFPLVGFAVFLLFCADSLISSVSFLRYRASANVINFRRASKNAKRNSENRSYIYKCAVCGRTDTENPDLEFRYCSRCKGYHCFCKDHRDSHIHFTE